MPGDAWSNPSRLGSAAAREMMAFLEQRALLADQVEVNEALFQALAVRPGMRVLEVGSGSGVLCRRLAQVIGERGALVGLDISPDCCAFAREMALERGCRRVRFVAGAAQALPCGEASFHLVFAARLLLHVADAAPVVREMARVVRPLGRVVLADWDLDTAVIDHPDAKLTRHILRWRADNYGANNASGRQLRRHLIEAGLGEVSVRAVPALAVDGTSSLTQTLRRAAQVACDGGAISPTEREGWVAELDRRLERGTLFASVSYFIAWGHRPAPVTGVEL